LASASTINASAITRIAAPRLRTTSSKTPISAAAPIAAHSA
jgi:hypothetical protein